MARTKTQVLKKGNKATEKVIEAKPSKVMKTPVVKNEKNKKQKLSQEIVSKVQIKKSKTAKKQNTSRPSKSTRKVTKNMPSKASFSLQSIKKLKPETHSKLQISAVTLKSVQDILNNVCTMVCKEASNLNKNRKSKTLNEMDIRAAFKTVLPKQLFAKVDNFASSKTLSPSAKKNVSKTPEVITIDC